MLLFSTVLDIIDSFTQEDFIRLVLEWNESSTHDENRVKGIDWHGERTIWYGTRDLWLEFIEDAERGILAVRHEKTTDDGVVWDSDFIMDFSRKQMSIQLDRTYSEEALVMNAAFSTPHFISMLIEHGYVKDDNGLPVTRTPIIVTDADSALCEAIFSNVGDFRLPVVFVSKTEQDENPLSIPWLASRLKGAAHVLVEQSAESCKEIRGILGRTEEPFGAVRVFFPSESVSSRKYTYHSAVGDQDARLEKVIRSVIHYGIAQRLDRTLTWNGVTSVLLADQLSRQITGRQVAEAAREKAEQEVEDVYDTFDEDLKSLQAKIEELTKANEALQYENQGLRAKYANSDDVPVLYLGEEEDFYQGEIRDFVLSVIDDALNATEKATRKADILADILENNPYDRLGEDRRQRIKALFKGYRTMTSAMRQELLSLGFDISEDGKHCKITYGGDPRYMITLPKTPSDHRSGSNCATVLNRKMF